MSKHRLPQGLRSIAFLQTLGNAMGYSVRLEYPVGKTSGTNEAVDVAWFLDNEQEYPLFVFEIESRTSSAMAYNPLKIFSKPSTSLPKPLFLFQIVLTGGVDSGVVDSLTQEFGRFNYEAFVIAQSGWCPVIKRVLEQHRRLSLSVNTRSIAEVLFEHLVDHAEVSEILFRLEQLHFRHSELELLPNYARLALEKKPKAIDYFLRVLAERIKYSGDQIAIYHTYYGDQWAYPIHLGVLSHSDPTRDDELFQELRRWQEHSTYMTVIGPHFGLSQEYDEFLIWISGGLLALLASLFRRVRNNAHYLAEIIRSVHEKIMPEWRLGNLIWLYHILAPIDRESKHYKYVVSELRLLNAFNLDVLLYPSRAVSGDDEWLAVISKKATANSIMSDEELFRSCRTEILRVEHREPLLLALDFLTRSNSLELPILQLVRSLYE